MIYFPTERLAADVRPWGELNSQIELVVSIFKLSKAQPNVHTPDIFLWIRRQTYRLMVSDHFRPWTPATTEPS